MKHSSSIRLRVPTVDSALESEPPSIAFANTSARLSEPAPRRAVLSALVLGALGGLLLLRDADSNRIAAAGNDLERFHQRCAQGDAVACNNLGVTYQLGYAVTPNAWAAFRAFELACQGGSPDGCNNQGALYERGEGTAQDLAEAVRLYERACTAGAALGCSNLGALRAQGKGVTRDDSEARRLFTLACQTGSAAGCSNLTASDSR
jgi:TPR repeat protein